MKWAARMLAGIFAKGKLDNGLSYGLAYANAGQNNNSKSSELKKGAYEYEEEAQGWWSRLRYDGSNDSISYFGGIEYGTMPMGGVYEGGDFSAYNLFGNLRFGGLNLATEFLEESFLNPNSVEEYATLRPDEPSPEQEELWEVGREQSARLAWKPFMYNPTLPYLLRRLKTLQTLIVSGRQDSIVPIDSLRIYNESIPGSSLSLIDQSGHRPEIEKPEDFLKLLINFLKKSLFTL